MRRLTAEDRPVDAVLDFDPRLGEQHRRPCVKRRGDTVVCTWPGAALALCADPMIRVEPGDPSTITITADQPLTVCLSVADRGPLVYVDPNEAWAVLQADEQCWRAWCDGLDDSLPRRETVVRSLLTLRLLTYSPSGAPVAAPTTSLPEDTGGSRNWDYRYAWPRDASIGIGAFLGAGRLDEARGFLAWLLHASRLSRPHLPVLFTLDGHYPSPERELAGWPGYANSRPVRTGSGAADQHQLDGYGWVLDAAWLLTQAGHTLYAETWRTIRGFADEVTRTWRGPDAGIWEIRGNGAHLVHSKLMAWLTLDRTLRIAGPAAPQPAKPRAGAPPATPSPRTSPPTATTPTSAPTRAPTGRPTSTPPSSCCPSSTSSRPTRHESNAPLTPSPATSTPGARSSTATRPAKTTSPPEVIRPAHRRSPRQECSSCPDSTRSRTEQPAPVEPARRSLGLAKLGLSPLVGSDAAVHAQRKTT